MLVQQGTLNHFLSNGIELSFLINGAISFDLSGQVSTKIYLARKKWKCLILFSSILGNNLNVEQEFKFCCRKFLGLFDEAKNCLKPFQVTFLLARHNSSHQCKYIPCLYNLLQRSHPKTYWITFGSLVVEKYQQYM